MDSLIQPVLSDEELLADIDAAAKSSDRAFHLWWLGQSGFLVQWQGRRLLIDPYLSNSLTKKYATTDKPHVRMTGIPIDPARLDFVDVVTSSHNHRIISITRRYGPSSRSTPACGWSFRRRIAPLWPIV